MTEKTGILIKTKIFEYAQAIQLLRLSLSYIQGPYVISFLAIVFSEENDIEFLEKINTLLFGYISPFIFSEPRDQTDLREKTLAIAVYVYLEGSSKQQRALPDEYINRYLEYAAKQDWYSDTYLAFFAGLSAAKFIPCENALQYFKNNYSAFILQENFSAICQALYLVPELTQDDRESGLKLINAVLATSDSQSYVNAWGLLALTSRVGTGINLDFNSLVKKLLIVISNITDPCLGWAFTKFSASEGQSVPISPLINDEREIDETGPLLFDPKFIDWAELGLVSACLCLSSCNYSTNIIGISDDNLERILEKSEATAKNPIIISRQANVLGNILAIIFTLEIGIIGIIYSFGLYIDQNSIKSSITPTLGDILIIPVWADYFLSQVQAMFQGESALEGMVKIPIIRHIVHAK